MQSKKEAKIAYKQLKFSMGVFQIRNTLNNTVLVDNSIDMESKWNRHKMELKFGNHRNNKLQYDWKELGETAFVFEVLAELTPNKKENTNYNKELRDLQDLVLDDLKIENRY